MFKLKTTIAAIVMLFSGSALADFTEFYRVDVTDSPYMVYGVTGDTEGKKNPACYAEINWRDGSRFQLVRDLEDGELYIFFRNNQWNIADETGMKKSYRLRANFEKHGNLTNGFNFEYNLLSKNIIVIRNIVKTGNFIPLFVENTKMTFIMPGDIQNSEVSLKGSLRVMEELSKCVSRADTLNLWPNGKPNRSGTGGSRRDWNI